MAAASVHPPPATSRKPTRSGVPPLPRYHHTSAVSQADRRRCSRHFDPHRDHRYFGRVTTNVTDQLRQVAPSHALHQTLIQQPPPDFHRRATSITGYVEEQVRGPRHQKRRPVTAPGEPYYGRRASNITEHMRYLPPAHLALVAAAKTLPHYGRLATSVTDPCRDVANFLHVDAIIVHLPQSRPSSARLPTNPQHVSKEELFTALSARGARPRRSTSVGTLLAHQFAHLADNPAPMPGRMTANGLAVPQKRPDTVLTMAKLPITRIPQGSTPPVSAPTSVRSATSDRKGASVRSAASDRKSTTRELEATKSAAKMERAAADAASAASVNDIKESIAQSSLCEDDSSETSQELGSEKMEFVSNWVKQPDWAGEPDKAKQHGKPWRTPPDYKTACHGRRSTSITKYNIW